MGMSVDCHAILEPDPEATLLLAKDARDFLAGLPDGAVIKAVTRDFGSQRDPDVRLVGLRASWSETRHDLSDAGGRVEP